MKKEIAVLEYAVLAVVLIGALAFFLNLRTQEIDFCRNVFQGLVKGRQQVAKFVDWENLKALGVDVAATYKGLRNDKEKAVYKKAFIISFSAGFKRVEGKLKTFTRWRIYKKDEAKTIVATDDVVHHKTLLFTLPAYGQKKLINIQWEAKVE